ncbi:MAG: glycogen/starch/alpha-glucan phosphorylase, partial [Pyrobaculum sp.]
TRVAAVNSLEELCKARSEIKREALEALGVDARGRLVISWARRVTRYKRPHFVLQLAQDVDRDVVYILGGRAHPEDSYGVEVMEKFRQLAGSMDNVYYFPQLDLDTMKKIIWASDIWLFTPFSGWEASGTSFMKAGINGVPSVTSRDGAVVEVVRDGVNGWLFGEDREKLMSIDDMEIDSREYREFRDKVIKAVDAYFDGSYWQVAYSAYKTFREYYTMDRLFKDYGYI